MRVRFRQSVKLFSGGVLLAALAAAVGCGSSSNSIQQNPVPVISNLSPASATAGASAQTLTINGTNFVSSSTATYNNVVHAVTFLSATQLQIQLTTADLASAGSFPVV
ncbi:MAG: IPT/TIG domain-containing protein, partial [Candidatus Sulfotelmatobacter sp.]